MSGALKAPPQRAGWRTATRWRAFTAALAFLPAMCTVAAENEIPRHLKATSPKITVAQKPEDKAPPHPDSEAPETQARGLEEAQRYQQQRILSGEEPTAGLQLSLIAGTQNVPETWNVHGLRLSLLGASNQDVVGVDLGLGLLYVNRDFRGLQMAFVSSMVERDMRGVQFGGVLFTGMPGAAAARDATGVQLGGLFASHCGGDLRGVQIAGVGNRTDGSMRGMQLGIIGNLGESDVRGVQFSGLFNRAETLHGLQIALVNYCRNLNGIQIGLINRCESQNLWFLPIINAAF